MTEHGARKPPATPSGKDGAGKGRGHRLLAAGLLLACIGGIATFALQDRARGTPGVDGETPATQADPRAAGDTPDAAAMQRQPLSARPIPATRDPNDLANYVVPGQPAPTMGESPTRPGSFQLRPLVDVHALRSALSLSALT